MQDIYEEEWPDEPSDYSWDLSSIPEWLCFIISLDQLHAYGLDDCDLIVELSTNELKDNPS